MEEKGIDWNLISSNTHSSLEISMQGRLKSQPDKHNTSFNSVKIINPLTIGRKTKNNRLSAHRFLLYPIWVGQFCISLFTFF